MINDETPIQPETPAPSEPAVHSSAWLGRAVVWLENAPHRVWCNVAPGNIYQSDGDPCDCGRDEIQAALDAMRRPNAEVSHTRRQEP